MKAEELPPANSSTLPPERSPDRPLSDQKLVALLATISATGPVTLNIYLPALPAVQQEFATSVPQVQLTLSLALLAYAVGLLIYGPLSDRFGRRPVILFGLGIFSVGTLICLLAPTLDLLILGRVIQSLGTGAGMIVSRAIVSDLFPHARIARTIAFLSMITVIGPTVSPLLGGFMIAAFGWRSLFALLLVGGLVITALCWRALPETRAAHARDVDLRSMASVTIGLLTRPAFAGLLLQGSIVYAVFLVFISTAPHVMVTGLHRGPTEYGSYFVLLASGYLVGNWLVTRLAARKGLSWLLRTGVVISAAATTVAVGFLALGLQHPLWIFLPMSVLGIGQGMALPNVLAGAVELAPKHAGLASSLASCCQQLIGAISVQFIGNFPVNTAYPMMLFCAGASLLGLVALQFFRPSNQT